MNNPLPKSTEDLLRAPLPESESRPGFETRLLAQLQDAPGKRSRRALWLPLSAAAALIIALLVSLPLLQQPAAKPGASVDPGISSQDPRPVLEIEELPNPLREQTTALTDRATRTGRFLIDCLPSLPESGNQL